MHTIPETSSQFKMLHSMLDAVLQQLFERDATADIMETLTIARSAFHELAASSFEVWIARRLGTGYSSRTITRDGQHFEFKGYRTKSCTSGFGEVAIKRAYYYSSSLKCGICPLEEEYPWLRHNLLPDAREMVCLVSSLDPYGQSHDLLEKLAGIFVSTTKLGTTARGIGGKLDEEAAVPAVAPDPDITSGREDPEPRLLVISADGAMIRAGNRWREVKSGAVYEIGQKKDGTLVARNKSFVSRMEDHEAFGDRLYKEAARRGVERAREVVVIGDGARWIQDMATTHYPQACMIIDWYHAVEHLWAAAELVFGRRDTDEAKDQVEEWKHLLFDGNIEELATRMTSHVPGMKSEVGKQLETGIEYFRRNRQRMQYRRFRAAGYPIGSGVIEGACKNLVQQRMKRAGMRWSVSGAHAILNLRCLFLSGRWKVVRDLVARGA